MDRQAFALSAPARGSFSPASCPTGLASAQNTCDRAPRRAHRSLVAGASLNGASSSEASRRARFVLPSEFVGRSPASRSAGSDQRGVSACPPPAPPPTCAAVETRSLGDEVRKDFPILDQEINGQPLVYLDNAATSQKPNAVLDVLRRYYNEVRRRPGRGVGRGAASAAILTCVVAGQLERAPGRAHAERAGDGRVRGGAPHHRELHQRGGPGVRDLHAQRNGGDQPRGLLLGPHDPQARRRDRPLRDGAPLEPHPLADRRAAHGGGHPVREAGGGRRAGRGERGGPHQRAHQARLARPRQQRARLLQPRQAHRGRRARRGRPHARRRLPERAPRARRRPGPRLRLARLLLPQDVRADGDRGAVRAAGGAGGDAAVHGRGRDDPGRLPRALHLQHAAAQVRGRHAGDRRGDRAGRGVRVHERDRDGAHPRVRDGADAVPVEAHGGAPLRGGALRPAPRRRRPRGPRRPLRLQRQGRPLQRPLHHPRPGRRRHPRRPPLHPAAAQGAGGVAQRAGVAALLQHAGGRGPLHQGPRRRRRLLHLRIVRPRASFQTTPRTASRDPSCFLGGEGTGWPGRGGRDGGR